MEQSVKQILSAIDDAIAGFQDAIPGIQKLVYDELQPVMKQLEIKNGKLLNNVSNLKLIGNLKNKLEKIIISAEYKKSVKKFIDSFRDVSNLNNDYFKQFNKKFKPKNTLPIIKQLAVESTINDLVGQGIKSSVIDPVQSILNQNITSGGNYAKFQEEIRNHILTNESGEGSLERYTKQITTDAIHQYNAQYHDTIAQDLQFNWGRYVGSNLTTSREFCILLTKKQWVHKSELPEIIKGHIGNETCKLSKSTSLPYGMVPGTNADNFKIRRGGYNCGHQFFWVPDSAVPGDVEAQLNKPNNEKVIEQHKKYQLRIDELKSLGAAGKYDTTNAEGVSILEYTKHSYFEINNALREGAAPVNSYTEALTKVLSKALKKLPVFEGPVFRGTDLTKQQLQEYIQAYKDDTQITHKFFTSSTHSAGKEFEGNTKYIITSKTGRLVKEFSKHGSAEDEVLFDAGTKFKVDKVTAKGGMNWVTLTEIP